MASQRIELGRGLICDVATLVDTRLLLQANSGGGKSWALRRLLEQTHGRVQQLVLDPEGEFASLRERYDYVLAARQGGDTAADPRSAKLLAERLLELGVSAILDIYELKAHERVRFVHLFLEALIDAPKRLWHPVLVVVDEAHVYCPQKGEAESAGAVIDLATRGRKRGYCAVLATQRISKLHKDAAAELNNRLIGRTAQDVDMKRAGEELGFTTREQVQSLRELSPGDFFGFGPAIAANGVIRGRVGVVATTHPKAGARLSVPTPPPTSRIRALLPKLADLPAEAEARVRTETELRKDLAEARRQVTALQRAAPTRQVEKLVTKRVEVPVVKPAELQRLERAVAKLVAAGGVLGTLADQVGAHSHRIAQAAKVGQDGVGAAPTLSRGTPPRLPALAPRPAAFVAAADASARPLGRGGDRRMLSALAQNPDGVTASKLALLSGIARKGGTFRTYLGQLRAAGWVVGGAHRLQITDAGAGALGDYDPLPTGPALIEWWRRELGASGMRTMLDVLVAAHPQPLTKADVAERAGIAEGGGTFRTYLGKLRTLELVTGAGDALRAAEVLFE